MNAVIYARFSSHQQQEQSIDGQIRACKEYADKHGYTVIRSYCDRAISGTREDRPEFQAMIQDAKKKEFTFILVWKLDRFSRNRYDSALYKRELQKSGVRVLSVTEGIGEGDESIILEALLEAMAEQYSLSLARNVKRGMRESAMQGKSTGGHILYGYKVKDKEYIIDPPAAEVVKRIYSLYAGGKTKAEVYRILNSEGLKICGKPFTYNAVDRILRNEKYTGLYKFEDITIEGGLPCIIEKDLFDLCKKRQATAPKHTKGKADYFLAGKAFCGYCGKALSGTSGTGRNGVHRYYICTKCRRTEKKEALEEYATEKACKYVLDPSNTEYISHRVADEYNKGFDPQRIQALQTRKNAILSKQTAIVDKLIDEEESIVKAAKKRFAELSEEAARIDETLAELQAIIPLQAKDVRDYLDQYCQGDFTDPNFQKRIIDTFVNCLYVWSDKLLIYFNVKANGDRVSYTQAAVDAELVCSTSDMVYHSGNTANLIFTGSFIGLFLGR